MKVWINIILVGRGGQTFLENSQLNFASNSFRGFYTETIFFPLSQQFPSIKYFPIEYSHKCCLHVLIAG